MGKDTVGYFKKGDIIQVKRTDENGGASFLVEHDSVTGLAGQRTNTDIISFARAGGVAGTRIDGLVFTSHKKLVKNGRTKVIQSIDVISDSREDSVPIPVVVKKLKQSNLE